MIWELIDATGRRYPLYNRTIIGRSSKAQIVLKQDPTVSRRHVELQPEPDGVIVRDLGSVNGTFVNRRRIIAPYKLRPGDRLTIGQTQFFIQPALETQRAVPWDRNYAPPGVPAYESWHRGSSPPSWIREPVLPDPGKSGPDDELEVWQDPIQSSGMANRLANWSSNNLKLVIVIATWIVVIVTSLGVNIWEESILIAMAIWAISGFIGLGLLFAKGWALESLGCMIIAGGAMILFPVVFGTVLFSIGMLIPARNRVHIS